MSIILGQILNVKVYFSIAKSANFNSRYNGIVPNLAVYFSLVFVCDNIGSFVCTLVMYMYLINIHSRS